MKIVSIVGTRPNFIKEVLINRELRARGVAEVLVHTGQHYDYEMSRIFFQEFDLPDPDYHLEVSTGLAGRQMGDMIPALETVLMEERPDATLVYGDVTSTLAGTLASVRLGIPVAHVEAGIRTSARYNPEEINRRGTDALSELLMANCQDAYDALLKENHIGSRVVLTGDVMNDILLETVRKLDIEVVRGGYHLCTIHRAETTDNPRNLSQIVEGLAGCKEAVRFPVHPRTRKRLEEFGLLDILKRARNVELTEPKGYADFVRMLAGANKVITDSGGVRREAYILGKPAIIAVDITWFPCILRAGWKTVVGADAQGIIRAVKEFEPPEQRPELFGDGFAHRKIADALEEYFGCGRNPSAEAAGR